MEVGQFEGKGVQVVECLDPFEQGGLHGWTVLLKPAGNLMHLPAELRSRFPSTPQSFHPLFFLLDDYSSVAFVGRLLITP